VARSFGQVDPELNQLRLFLSRVPVVQVRDDKFLGDDQGDSRGPDIHLLGRVRDQLTPSFELPDIDAGD
jgi:hypothetical protein